RTKLNPEILRTITVLQNAVAFPRRELHQQSMTQMLTKEHHKSLEEISHKLSDCVTELRELADKYQVQFDELSEKGQESDKGQELASLAGSFQEAAEYAQQALDALVAI